jgi:hypothetical protein
MPQGVDVGGGRGATESSKGSRSRAAQLPTIAHPLHNISRCTRRWHGRGRAERGSELAGPQRTAGSKGHK